MRKQYYCIEEECNKKVSGKNRRCKHHAVKFCHKTLKSYSNHKDGRSLVHKKCLICNSKIYWESTYCVKCFGLVNGLNIRNTGKYNGINNPMAGKKQKLETKLKISKKMIERFKNIDNRKQMSLIKGGTGIPYENSKYPEEFFLIKKSIRKRDNYKCQNCNTRALDVHHIDYDKKNNKEENLLVLCEKCNNRANYNRNNWKEYYQNKMEKILCNIQQSSQKQV